MIENFTPWMPGYPSIRCLHRISEDGKTLEINGNLDVHVDLDQQRRFEKIIGSGGQVLKPVPKLTAEELHDKSKAAAEAFVKACEDAAEAMARAIMPLAKRAKDQDMPKELAAGALTGMMVVLDMSGDRIEAALDNIANEFGVEI